MQKRRAFTLVELLVVIAIIALLMSILVPALRKARDHAMRVVCGENVKNIMIGLTVYADDNRNKIPTTGGYWPWDMDWMTCAKILKYMSIDYTTMNLKPNEDIPVQKVFFCPANVQQKRNMDLYWNFAVNKTNYRSGYRVLGYFFLWAAGWNGNGKSTIRGPDGNPDPSKRWVDRIDIAQPANAELVTDPVLSDNADTTFIKVMAGGMPGYGQSPDSTSHITSEKKPAGGNIGFADNHVEWRNFSDMCHRYGGNPHFWW